MMNSHTATLRVGLRLAALLMLISVIGCAGPGKADDLQVKIESAVALAGDNAPQIRRALAEVPAAQRAGMRFLVAYMPEEDLKHLSADYLLQNVQLAYAARERAPWKESLTDELFFNDVLPYACVNEKRDAWREDFFNRFGPLVADARTPGEAAVILNQKIFDMLGVKFSRKRIRADQSPLETIESGMASCTGLSILLVDACRAVGIPARVAGTPMWPDQSGNHSWVEVWDNGWHHTGAAEPAGGRLGQAWFTKRAATAIADVPQHAIYATSYRPTGTVFPLVWAPMVQSVHAVNVTDRYRALAPVASAAPAEEQKVRQDVEASLHALAQLRKYLEIVPSERRPWTEQVFYEVPLTAADAMAAGQLIYDDQVAQLRRDRAAEMQARRLNLGELTMPFFYSVWGEKPEAGRSLYISMHGGGEAPKKVNDQQWENQKKLYRVDEGVYVAPRAPTDKWNMWHQAHIDAFLDRLIQNMVIFEQVDPNRVYLLGYSAGGDGVYQLAPRMADRFAAAAMMAGHPNESQPLGLRNLPFTIHAGELDGALKRNAVARSWGEQLDALQQADPDGYVHWTKIHEGKGHWMNLQDAAALPWMSRYTRNALPEKIVWRQDDVRHGRFYWLAVPEDQQKKDALVRASRRGQRIDVQSDDVKQLIVLLNDQMLNLDEVVTITCGEHELYTGRVTRTIATLARTIHQRPDRAFIFSAQVSVSLPDKP